MINLLFTDGLYTDGNVFNVALIWKALTGALVVVGAITAVTSVRQ